MATLSGEWWLVPAKVSRAVEVASEGKIRLLSGERDAPLAAVLRDLSTERPGLPQELLWWAFLARSDEDGWRVGERDRRRLLGSTTPGSDAPEARGLRGCLERAASSLAAHRAREGREKQEKAQAKSKTPPPSLAKPDAAMVATKNLRGLAELRDRIKTSAQALRGAREEIGPAPLSNDEPWNAEEAADDGHS